MAMNIFELFGSIFINNRDANQSLDETSSKAERTGKRIQAAFKNVGEASLKIGKVIAGGAAAVGTAWAATVETTRDYRTAMAQLDTAFVTNGHSAETATRTYKDLQAVLGETDQAVEAANHLAVMCDNEKELYKWTDICTGVYATFGDSLPIEGLTESANETAKVGQVTGSLADALNWAGINEDDFNKKLSACTSEQERQDLIMNTLYWTYKAASDQYKETAKDVLDANKAHENMTSALAKIGEVGEPIMSGLKNWISEMVNAAVPYLEKFVGWIDTNRESLSKIGDKISEMAGVGFGALLDGFIWMTENGETVTAVLAGIGAALAAGAIAAHPYAAAIMAVVAGLVLLNEHAKKAQEEYQNTFTEELSAPRRLAGKYAKWTDDQKTAAQNYISDYLGGYDTTAAVVELQSVGLSEDAITDFRMDMSEALNDSEFTAEISDTWFEEGTEANLQSQIDQMTFDAAVHLYADNSNLDTLYSIASGNGIGTPDGSHASGLPSVPYDGYIARVHKDEAILNKEQADAWRGGGSAKMEALLAQIVNLLSAGQVIQLDSGIMAGQLTPAIDARLGVIQGYKERGN